MKTDSFHCFPQVRVSEQAGDGIYGLAEGRERVNGGMDGWRAGEGRFEAG